MYSSSGSGSGSGSGSSRIAFSPRWTSGERDSERELVRSKSFQVTPKHKLEKNVQVCGWDRRFQYTIGSNSVTGKVDIWSGI